MHQQATTRRVRGVSFLALLFAIAFAALCTLPGLLLPRAAAAQTFDFGGFIKSSYYYDTRAVATARNEDFLLYPVRDANPDGDDATDTDRVSATQLFSRLNVAVSGLPEALGAEVTAYVEADFYGPGTLGDAVNNQENVFRARRLFGKMVWDDRELLAGLEWTPLFTVGTYAHTVATEAGTPFNPFSRQPMVKFTYKPGNFRLIGITGWEFDAFREGPFPDPNFPDAAGNPTNQTGIDQQQNAAIPALHGHVQYVGEGGLFLGAGGYFKSLRPVATGERFYSGAGVAYLTYTNPAFIVRAKGVYGTLRDHVMPGGYFYDGGSDEFDADGNAQYVSDAFKTQDMASGWIEIEKTGTVAPGLFAGYLVNVGSRDEIDDFANVGTGNLILSPLRSPTLDSVWEVAPRLVLNYGALRFGLEAQITNATWAGALDENLRPTGPTDSVINVRGNASLFVFF